MAVRTTFLVAVAVAVIVCTNMYSVHGIPDSYYMEDYCPGSGTQIFVDNNGVRLLSQRGTRYQDNLDCTLTFYTSEGKVLNLASDTIELENSLDCIYITDGQRTSIPSVTHCTNDPLRYITTQRYVTIRMTTDISLTYPGFSLSVTPQDSTLADVPCSYSDGYYGYGDYQCHDGNGCYSEHDKCNSYSECADGTDDKNCDHCDYGSFHCVSSRQCVNEYKMCDGYKDCSNGEDENLPECSPSIWMYWSGGQMAGVVIGYVIFLVIVIAIVVVVNKNCKK